MENRAIVVSKWMPLECKISILNFDINKYIDSWFSAHCFICFLCSAWIVNWNFVMLPFLFRKKKILSILHCCFFRSFHNLSTCWCLSVHNSRCSVWQMLKFSKLLLFHYTVRMCVFFLLLSIGRWNFYKDFIWNLPFNLCVCRKSKHHEHVHTKIVIVFSCVQLNAALNILPNMYWAISHSQSFRRRISLRLRVEKRYFPYYRFIILGTERAKKKNNKLHQSYALILTKEHKEKLSQFFFSLGSNSCMSSEDNFEQLKETGSTVNCMFSVFFLIFRIFLRASTGFNEHMAN